MAQAEEEYDPSNPFIQAMLVFALLACISTIVMIAIQLNQQYDVTFGGILDKPAPQQPTNNASK